MIACTSSNSLRACTRQVVESC
ncbi:hypothetical protein D046_2981A, partial [Vibrio parahaemolyticus V-223/04]